MTGFARLCFIPLVAGVLIHQLDTSAFAEDCSVLEANANVVEISMDGVKRLGSGVLITFDGYVITAAHLILEGIRPPYPIAVFVRQPQSVWKPASVKRMDSALDLALLKLNSEPQDFRALRVAREALQGLEDRNDYPICLSGFGIYKDEEGTRIEQPFRANSAVSRGRQLGYLLANEPVQEGYSGGAAFFNGNLLGIILRRLSDHGSFIVPLPYVVDFVSAGGIFLNQDDSFALGPHWSEMPRLVDNIRINNDLNRLEIVKILHSVEWRIELKKIPGEFSIVFTPKRAFPGQMIEGTFVGSLRPYFDSEEFRRYVDKNPAQSFEIGGTVTDGVIEIPEVVGKSELVRAKYESLGVPVGKAKVTKFEITGSILFRGIRAAEIAQQLEAE
jgi:hypothetical protein